MVDYVEVGRTAHQLDRDHGDNAWRYANGLADEAKLKGKNDDSEFWLAVSRTLEPRN
jgi:hypothetical protein